MSFVYIIKAYNDEGSSSVVVGHVVDRKEAINLMKTLSRVEAVEDFIDYEGPVLAENYPIGHIINEESPDE